MKKPRNEQGLKDLHRSFGVVTKPGQSGPMMTDVDSSRGDFRYLPEGIMRVADYGAPTKETGLGRVTTSPASATFTAGRVNTSPSQKTTRVMPENHLLGSLNVLGAEGRMKSRMGDS